MAKVTRDFYRLVLKTKTTNIKKSQRKCFAHNTCWLIVFSKYAQLNSLAETIVKNCKPHGVNLNEFRSEAIY